MRPREAPSEHVVAFPIFCPLLHVEGRRKKDAWKTQNKRDSSPMGDSNNTEFLVDLESLVLVNSGLRIEERQGMGRLAVTTKSFNVLYEKAIREKPLLVWIADDMLDYVKRFKSADTTTQSAILDMYHPPPDAPSVTTLKPKAVRLATFRIYDDASFIHKLMAIAATNAHQYYGEKVEARGGDLKQYELGFYGAKKSALFVYASKIAHSCLPNLAYTSQTDDGALEYKVIRPIAQGEPATFSYIGELFQTPTNKRREQLFLTKSFKCECDRCSGPDYCRFIKCTDCAASFVPCIYDDQGQATWTCDDCGPRKDMAVLEMKFENRLKALEVRRAEQPLKPLQDLVKDASKSLSPVHFITIKAQETVAQLSASKAASQQRMQQYMGMMMGPRRNPFGATNVEFRSIAAEEGLKAVVACECVAAACPGCYKYVSSSLDVCSFPHDPVYECGSKIFHASTDLMEIPEMSWPKFAAALVQRYLPAMKGLFGESDKDVLFIEDKITASQSFSSHETDGRRDLVMNTPKAAVVPKKNHQQKPRSSKKKKKGRGKR